MRLFKDLREMPRWEVAVLTVAVVAMSAWWSATYWVSRPGTIAVTVVPADATVLLDNVKLGDRSTTIETRPGPYTLSITRDGYAREDRNVEVRPGRAIALKVTLEPSPDTGFELTSDPPGQLAWLDGEPMRDGSGAQARSVFRASRIAPGEHVLELRGAGFKGWRQSFIVEPGAIRRIHATMVPRLPN